MQNIASGKKIGVGSAILVAHLLTYYSCLRVYVRYTFFRVFRCLFHLSSKSFDSFRFSIGGSVGWICHGMDMVVTSRSAMAQMGS